MKNLISLFRRHPARMVGIVALLAVAIFGIYRFVGGNASQASAATPGTPSAVASTGPAADTAAGGGSCCAVPASSTPVQGEATVTGETQKIYVDIFSGIYDPSVLNLAAGIPAEITFAQSSGCTAYVQSEDLGFQADLTSGPQTIKLPGLQPGTYRFACGMNMVTGAIVVE